MPKLKQAKSLTDKLYDEIGNCFRDLWGPYAGWAHSVSLNDKMKMIKKNLLMNKPFPLYGRKSNLLVLQRDYLTLQKMLVSTNDLKLGSFPHKNSIYNRDNCNFKYISEAFCRII